MSKVRVLYFLISFLIAIASSYFAGELLVRNSDAYEYLTTVLTVFAGFLFAVLSILGDPTLIKDGTWRIAELNRSNVSNSIVRIGYLFALYLLALASLGISVMLKNEGSCVSQTQLWMGRSTILLGTLALLLTLPLPLSISKIQMWRYDNEIERRRAESKSHQTEK